MVLDLKLTISFLFIVFCYFFCTWGIIATYKSYVVKKNSSGHSVLIGNPQVPSFKKKLAFLFHFLTYSQFIPCHSSVCLKKKKIVAWRICTNQVRTISLNLHSQIVFSLCQLLSQDQMVQFLILVSSVVLPSQFLMTLFNL